jgi:RecB family exonuclease
MEERGALALKGLDFTLTGKPDRIDRLEDGRLLLIDYKTGEPPSPKQQAHFDKQLLLLAAMAEGGGFKGLDAEEVARLVYVGLKAELKLSDVALEPGTIAKVWEEFGRLMASYAMPAQGYTARRAMEKTTEKSDYDHLSRFGEWDVTRPPVPEDLA